VYRTIAQCDSSIDTDGYYTFTYANNQIQHGTQCFFRVRALNLSTVPGANAFTPSAARPVYANSAVKTGTTASATTTGSVTNWFRSGRGGWTESIIITKPGTTVGLNAPFVRPQ
ncbi:MAG: hypothetical protein LBH28_10555, partial [Oscillospiraceae bacterium]|nr:hypothetical protein [Oscillospiraceae bacterium]